MAAVIAQESGTSEAVRQCLKECASALIVFSHLRWDGVYQRPQHLLSRFARDIPVTVIEEPMFLLEVGAEARLDVYVDDGVTVLTPMIPIGSAEQRGFGEDTREDTKRLIATHLAPLARDDARSGHHATVGPIVWYYTPMALGTLPDDIEPSLVVFDAMDDLASFRHAPQSLRDQEEAMFRAADLVFAGGPSLYEARRHRHPSVHCFPSGVEVHHFARAADGLAPPDSLTAFPHPVLGYYGVLDERIDFDLIAAVADARPDWTVALVGPTAKIAESDLPRRPNIAYFGQQPYADLPNFLAGFDVTLLPFALNEATRSISPTKTLEYLAAGKPIVSTPIADVVSLYGDVARIAGEPARFVAEIEAALTESISDQQQRRAAGQAHLLAHDWDAIVDGMATLMVEALTIENPTARSGT